MSDPFETLFGVTKEAETEDEKIKKYLMEGTKIGATSEKYKLNMFDALRAMDLKNRDFYDNLSDQEKKGFAPFVMVRWASAVDHPMQEMDEWWLKATNQRFNTDLLNLTGDVKHPKLQWLMATTASPGMGAMRHQWVGYKKKTSKVNNKVKNFLIEQFPTLNDDEIMFLMELLSKKEIKQYALDLGYNDKDINAIFK